MKQVRLNPRKHGGENNREWVQSGRAQAPQRRFSIALLLLLLSLLTLPFVLLSRLPGLRDKPALRGCIGITLVFCTTGIAHFVVTDKLATMIPPVFPAPRAIIYLTGLIEIGAGLAVLFKRTRRAAGWFLVVFLAMLLPFNIYAAVNHLPLAGHELGWVYLIVRVPVQGFLAWWCWRFACRGAF